MSEDHPITRAEIDNIAELAATKAVDRTFRLLGVDVNDQKAVNELRDTLTYATRLRRWSDGTKLKVWLTFVTIIVAGALVMFADSIKAFLRLKS